MQKLHTKKIQQYKYQMACDQICKWKNEWREGGVKSPL